MRIPLFPIGLDFMDPGRYPAAIHGLEVLARLLLDLAGYGFLAIALVFVVLNVYGACSSLRRGRGGAVALGAAPATEDALETAIS